jgi:NADH-quinone oxidoreductase subunit J
MIDGSTIVFYLLAALTLTCGILSVTTRLIFRAAIFLLFSLIGIAGIYFWLQYEFIAAVQIVIYAGGITVLIIFSIFLTQQAGDKLPKQKTDKKIIAALVAFCGFGLVMLQVYKQTLFETSEVPVKTSVFNIGKKMLSVTDGGYALPFEIISMLLLAAMIGCIVIAMKTKPEEK